MKLLGRTVVALVTLAGVVAQARAQTLPRLDESQLRTLGASLASYFDARERALDVDSARSTVIRSLDELRTSLAGWDPLKTTADLGRALELARRVEASTGREGKVSVEIVKEGSFAAAGLEFAYRLPKEYDATRRYPLVLAIPDHDERPADHIRANWTLAALRDAAIVVSPSMPDERADWTRVVVKGKPGGLCHALTVLRVATERFASDVDRVYVVGRGNGVPAAIACGNYSPQRFAGVIGRAGDAGDVGPDNFFNLPTYFAGAGARATAFQEAALKLGIDHCVVAASGTEEQLWEWIGDNPRRHSPTRVTLVPGDPFPTRAYWLRVAPSASDARATAVLERESNTVRISANGISGVTLLLNDTLLDLDRTVRVVCNDTELSIDPQRSLSDALEFCCDGTSDTSSVYVARADIDLSGRSASTGAETPASKDKEFSSRLAEAARDADKLWELYLSCKSQQRNGRAELVARKLVRVAPDHEQARSALGHVRSGTLWFASPEALARFERGQEAATAEARGLVKLREGWVHPDERTLIGKGLIREDETGLWLTGNDRERLAKGWVRRDLDWIEPKDVERVDLGLWRVDGEWLELDSANRRRAAIDTMWRIPTREVLLQTTTDRDVAFRAIEHMGRAIDDLRRVFGAEPLLPLSVALLRDEEQYDRFAFGDPDGRRRATHAGRLHTVHYGFFAESWFPPSEGRLEFRGMGVGYWDAFLPNGDAFGIHSARFACGLSYVEALDPSPKAVRAVGAGKLQRDYYDAYQAEKRLPAWLRYGGAVYAERYFRDVSVGPDGDAWWARKWSLDNLRSLGGLTSLNDVLAFQLDPDERDKSRKLLLEAGLVIAFMVDGECAPVNAAHAELKRGLVTGRLHAKDVAALVAALVANEQEVRAFAGS